MQVPVLSKSTVNGYGNLMGIMRMKKILFITDTWAPQVNGVVRVLTTLVGLLKARGYDIAIVEPGQFATVPLPGYPEIRLALFPRARIAEKLEEFQPDAVHIMTEGPLGFAARALCVKKRIPFTTSYHTHFALYTHARAIGMFMRPVYWYLKRFHRKGVATIVSTESLKEELEAAGFRKNMIVVPLGVATEHFVRNPSPALPILPAPVFLFFGRLAPEKSPEEFLKLDLPGTKLVIGDGPERHRLEKKYGKRNLFVGYKHGQELVDWLSLSDVLVFPSRTDTFGLVVLEALSCGIPVAAHDVMGPHDILTHGKDGFLGEDLREVALACLELDPADCRNKALQYSWEHSAEAFLHALHFIR